MDAKSGAGRGILTTVLTFAIATIAMAAGASMSKPTPVPPASADTAAQPSDASVAQHGGPIERVHDAAQCDLVDVSTLRGNWTHGDYVSAVAQSGTADEVRQAAVSECGKPSVAASDTSAGNGEPVLPSQAGDGRAHAHQTNPSEARPPRAVPGPPQSAGASGHVPGTH